MKGTFTQIEAGETVLVSDDKGMFTWAGSGFAKLSVVTWDGTKMPVDERLRHYLVPQDSPKAGELRFFLDEKVTRGVIVCFFREGMADFCVVLSVDAEGSQVKLGLSGKHDSFLDAFAWWRGTGGKK